MGFYQINSVTNHVKSLWSVIHNHVISLHITDNVIMLYIDVRMLQAIYSLGIRIEQMSHGTICMLDPHRIEQDHVEIS